MPLVTRRLHVSSSCRAYSVLSLFCHTGIGNFLPESIGRAPWSVMRPPMPALRPAGRVIRHTAPASSPWPFHEDRHAHVHILGAQLCAVVPEAHADVRPFQLFEHVPQTVIHALERMLRMGFQIKA